MSGPDHSVRSMLLEVKGPVLDRMGKIVTHHLRERGSIYPWMILSTHCEWIFGLADVEAVGEAMQSPQVANVAREYARREGCGGPGIEWRMKPLPKRQMRVSVQLHRIVSSAGRDHHSRAALVRHVMGRPRQLRTFTGGVVMDSVGGNRISFRGDEIDRTVGRWKEVTKDMGFPHVRVFRTRIREEPEPVELRPHGGGALFAPHARLAGLDVGRCVGKGRGRGKRARRRW